MKHNNKYETWCPLFPGFYGSVFEYDNEEQDIEFYNEKNKTDYDWDDFDWDYADYHKRVSKAFVNRLERELNDILPVKFEFQELHSPKEYNFYNDSIWIIAKVSINKMIRLIKDKKEEAAQYFKDRYTSCSGFISFHSNNIEDWINPAYIKADTGHRIGALLDCVAKLYIDDYDDNMIYWTDSENYIDFSPKKEIPA